MEKLTLKEIAGYLPYGLEIKSNITGTIFEMAGISFRGSIQDKNGFDVAKIEICKPLLLPLEMLTKTIVHNEVEIIPIVELAKINYTDHKDYTFEVSENLCLVEIIGIANKTFGFNQLGDFWRLEGSRSVGISKQLKLFELLHELHFDLYGLLGRNLAIDKSTLNSK